ncbi:MAG: hypothetical protein MI747_08640 [Desulfobacterales bacterium]|nr:hypothetical protein [Desulfobacterales bacterium]
MDIQHQPSVYLHFRFKFLAITSIAFLLYVILTAGNEFSQFAQSSQFKFMGPFFLGMAAAFLFFRQVPLRCPHCRTRHAVKYDWTCSHCGQGQGKNRCLADKCLKCGQLQAAASCLHCGESFRL